MNEHTQGYLVTYWKNDVSCEVERTEICYGDNVFDIIMKNDDTEPRQKISIDIIGKCILDRS